MTLFDAVKQNPLLGEDTWEVFEAIEDSFAVDLGDYNSVCGKTIEELAKDVNKKANYPSKERCISAVSFYRLRRVLVSLLNIPRAEIWPSTSLEDLLPPSIRKDYWKQIEDKLGLKLPGLAIPDWALGISLVLPAAVLVYLKVGLGLHLTFGAIFGLAIVLAIPMLALLKPFFREIPIQGGTVGGLAKAIVAKNYAILASEGTGSDLGDVQQALLQLVALQTARKLDEIHPTMRIPQDLNIF